MSVYLNKENKTWFYQFMVQRNKVRKVFKGRGFATKRECEKEERIRKIEVANEVESQQSKAKKRDITIDSITSIFFETKEMSCKESTVHIYKELYKRHIQPVLGKINADRISQNMIMIIKRNLSVDKIKNSKLILGLLRSIIDKASDYAVIDRTVINELRIAQKSTFIKEEMKIWALDEFNRFISVVPDGVYKTFFTVLFYSGMRLAEARALTYSDVKDNYIYVNKTITSRYGVKDKICTTKTHSSVRKITMPEWILNLIRNNEVATPQSFIFSSDGKGPFSEPLFRKALKKYVDISGVKKIRIHDFRHSHASYLINNGVPIKAVSKRLGHNSVKTTMDTYWHLLDNYEDDIMNLLTK